MRAAGQTVSTAQRFLLMRKAVEHLKASDPALGAVIQKVGPCRMTYTEPTLHNLTRSIVYQQLSGKVASVIFGRLTAHTGDPVRAAAVVRLTDEQMRAIGLSRQKAAYVRDLAAREKEIQFSRLHKLSDADVIERLTQVKGIGVWTAHMFLMFALRRPNVLPTLDLGIRMAIRNLYEMDGLPAPKQVETIAAPWHPWCSVASWYLWRSLDKPVTE